MDVFTNWFSGAIKSTKEQSANIVIKSLSKFIIFFLGMPYRLASFLTIYKALLIGLFVEVYFYTEIVIEVAGKT